MAKSKQDLLAKRQKIGRPSLRRAVVTDPEQEDAVVQKVADNPPAPAAKPAARGPRTAPPKATASAAVPPATKPAAKRRATSRKTTASAPAQPEKEPFMRMTFDVPKSLHLQLKLYALQNGTTIKAHMLKLIEQSLKK